MLWVTLTDTKEQPVEPKSQEFVIPQEVMLGTGKQVSSLMHPRGLRRGGVAGAQVLRVKGSPCSRSSSTLLPTACLNSWMHTP